MEKRLTKSTTNKMLLGVCGGLAEYFQVDATIIRLLWVLFSLCGGSGVLAYLAAALIIPQGPETL
jgi:phage shock protein C